MADLDLSNEWTLAAGLAEWELDSVVNDAFANPTGTTQILLQYIGGHNDRRGWVADRTIDDNPSHTDLAQNYVIAIAAVEAELTLNIHGGPYNATIDSVPDQDGEICNVTGYQLRGTPPGQYVMAAYASMRMYHRGDGACLVCVIDASGEPSLAQATSLRVDLESKLSFGTL